MMVHPVLGIQYGRTIILPFFLHMHAMMVHDADQVVRNRDRQIFDDLEGNFGDEHIAGWRMA